MVLSRNPRYGQPGFEPATILGNAMASQVDVQLDKKFEVVSTEADDEGAASEDD